ncbi:hypothetical protein P692DRAFT_20913606 [Suillus brevipes Sb2]|nr:hypothetical protein P692DRAFT_20913606 [Suillus brevipes Sb2]
MYRFVIFPGLELQYFLWFSMSRFKPKGLVRFAMRLGSTRTRFHKVTETLLDQRNIYVLIVLYSSLVQPRLDSSANYTTLHQSAVRSPLLVTVSVLTISFTRRSFGVWLSTTLQSLRVLNGLHPLQFRFGAHSAESVDALTSGKCLTCPVLIVLARSMVR